MIANNIEKFTVEKYIIINIDKKIEEEEEGSIKFDQAYNTDFGAKFPPFVHTTQFYYPDDVGPGLNLNDLEIDEEAKNANMRSTSELSPDDELEAASISFDIDAYITDSDKAEEDTTCDEYWKKYDYYEEDCCCCFKELGFKGCCVEEEEFQPEEPDLKDMYAASMEMCIKNENK
jgi:hypothetical protein